LLHKLETEKGGAQTVLGGGCLILGCCLPHLRHFCLSDHQGSALDAVEKKASVLIGDLPAAEGENDPIGSIQKEQRGFGQGRGGGRQSLLKADDFFGQRR